MEALSDLSEKKKVELPKALREIVKLLNDKGPLTYEEIAEELGKDETTIIRQCQKLLEQEIIVKVEKSGKTAVALRDDVEVDEEGNVYLPSPFEDPMEKIKTLLEEAGVKGRKLRWIMRLVESNPEALVRPDVLFDILTGAGVRRQLAHQIVRAYFGTDIPIVAPMMPLSPPMQVKTPYPYYPGGPVGYGMYPVPGPYVEREREILRLESRIEKLMDEIRDIKDGGRREQDHILLLKLLEMRDKDRDQLWSAILKQQETIRDVVDKLSEKIENITKETEKMLRETFDRFEKILKEREEAHRKEVERMREEILKTKEEMYKMKEEQLSKQLKSLDEYVRQLPEKIRSEVEREWKHKLEIEQIRRDYEQKLKELEEKKSLRELVVSKLDKMTEKIDKLVDRVDEYVEAVVKKRLGATLKEEEKVGEEEKEEIVRRIREKLGLEPTHAETQAKEAGEELCKHDVCKAEEAEEAEEVKLRVVEGEK